jgi:hypothetical protein
MNEEIAMKQTRYSEPQILSILKQAEGGITHGNFTLA